MTRTRDLIKAFIINISISAGLVMLGIVWTIVVLFGTGHMSMTESIWLIFSVPFTIFAAMLLFSDVKRSVRKYKAGITIGRLL